MADALKHTLSLIVAAKNGDKTALEKICERYIGRVHKIVTFRMGRNLREKAESMDLVQSVMIKVIRGIDGYDTGSESKFINWLAKIVENTIRDKIDYFKAEKRRASSEVPIEGTNNEDESNIAEIPDGISSTVAHQVELHEELSMLCKALDKIKDSHREVIILRDYAGMTFKEIGELTGSTEDAARMLYVRSIDEVTDILSDMIEE